MERVRKLLLLILIASLTAMNLGCSASGQVTDLSSLLPGSSPPAAPDTPAPSTAPEVTSFSVTNSQFTSKTIQISMAVKNASAWCLSLSDNNPDNCSWSTGALPTSYTFSNNPVIGEASYSDIKENKTLYAWVKNDKGEISSTMRHNFVFNPKFPIQATSFYSAKDVAFDSSGNFYVLDLGQGQNDGDAVRVQYFNAAKEYQFGFGRKGSENSRFNAPTALALDSKRNLYVADAGNNRIQKFDSTGKFLKKFGSLGTGAGQFNGILELVIDSNDNLYTFEKLNYRVQKFDSEGNFLLQFGSQGVATGQFTAGSDAVSMAFDPAGNLLVMDPLAFRIQRFSPLGVFVDSFTVPSGSAAGQFSVGSGPQGIICDSAGNIFLTEYNQKRLQKFSSSGVYISNFTFSTNYPGRLRLTHLGQFSSTEFGMMYGNRIGIYDPLTGFVGLLHNQVDMGLGGNSVTLTSLHVDPAGNIFATDSSNHKVYKFNSSGQLLLQFGSSGTANGQLSSPFGIAVDSTGNIFVGDYGNTRVQKFDPSGNYLGKITLSGANNKPRMIRINATDDIFVLGYESTSMASSLFKLSSSGGTITELNVINSGASLYRCFVTDASGNPVVFQYQALFSANERTLNSTLGIVSTKALSTASFATGILDCTRNPINGDIHFQFSGVSGPLKYVTSDTYIGIVSNGFISFGNGDQFAGQALAFDSAGNIYSGEFGRIQKLNTSNQYLFQ